MALSYQKDVALLSRDIKLTPSNVQKRTNLVRKTWSTARALRAAQGVRELVDVFDGVFEGLYLGEGLASFAVVRRQVVAELVQSLREAPHPHLLPLAGLHASLGGHLGLARPLLRSRGGRRPASGEGEREIADVLVPAGEAHLRRGAHGVHRGVR